MGERKCFTLDNVEFIANSTFIAEVLVLIIAGIIAVSKVAIKACSFRREGPLGFRQRMDVFLRVFSIVTPDPCVIPSFLHRLQVEGLSVFKVAHFMLLVFAQAWAITGYLIAAWTAIADTFYGGRVCIGNIPSFCVLSVSILGSTLMAYVYLVIKHTEELSAQKQESKVEEKDASELFSNSVKDMTLDSEKPLNVGLGDGIEYMGDQGLGNEPSRGNGKMGIVAQHPPIRL